jgi:endonuclease III
MAPMDHLLLSILRPNASAARAVTGLRALREEFVDFNEMRVAPAKDIQDLLGRDMPGAREKAERLVDVLERLFDRGVEPDLAGLSSMNKRELRSHLREVIGLDSYAEAYLTAHLVGGHAIPVDQRLLERLKERDLVHPAATAEDARLALERIVSAKETLAVCGLLAQYAAAEAAPGAPGRTRVRRPPAKAAKGRKAKAKIKSK